MFSETSAPDFDTDPHCADCGRSIITRFGGVPGRFCDSCANDWERILTNPNGVTFELYVDDDPS